MQGVRDTDNRGDVWFRVACLCGRGIWKILSGVIEVLLPRGVMSFFREEASVMFHEGKAKVCGIVMFACSWLSHLRLPSSCAACLGDDVGLGWW